MEPTVDWKKCDVNLLETFIMKLGLNGLPDEYVDFGDELMIEAVEDLAFDIATEAMNMEGIGPHNYEKKLEEIRMIASEDIWTKGIQWHNLCLPLVRRIAEIAHQHIQGGH